MNQKDGRKNNAAMVTKPGNGRVAHITIVALQGYWRRRGGKDERTSFLPLLIGGDSHMWALGNPVFPSLSCLSFVESSVLYEG